jgi:hypothetical protein
MNLQSSQALNQSSNPAVLANTLQNPAVAQKSHGNEQPTNQYASKPPQMQVPASTPADHSAAQDANKLEKLLEMNSFVRYSLSLHCY